jgi:hypothetical protein
MTATDPAGRNSISGDDLDKIIQIIALAILRQSIFLNGSSLSDNKITRS